MLIIVGAIKILAFDHWSRPSLGLNTLRFFGDTCEETTGEPPHQADSPYENDETGEDIIPNITQEAADSVPIEMPNIRVSNRKSVILCLSRERLPH
jgi:hypothetical protein